MTAWDAAAWIKAFRAAGGEVWMHGNELSVGWKVDGEEQEARARALYDEYRSDPARRYAVVAVIDPDSPFGKPPHAG
jgi:hypothetical protein